MSPMCCSCDATRPSAAVWNVRIRDLVAGTPVWTPEALAELAHLRAGWQAAVEREQLADAA